MLKINNIMEIYKTINIVTGDFYIGCHTKNNKDYLGSGTKLKEQIENFGRDCFKRETLLTINNTCDKDLLKEVEEVFINKYYNDDKCLNIYRGVGSKKRPNMERLMRNCTDN